jgi:hypothetical protein
MKAAHYLRKEKNSSFLEPSRTGDDGAVTNFCSFRAYSRPRLSEESEVVGDSFPSSDDVADMPSNETPVPESRGLEAPP